MLYLVLYIFSVIVFDQILRYSQQRNARTVVVVAVNYVAATLATLVGVAHGGMDSYSPVEWSVVFKGAVNGLLYFAGLIVILAAYRIAGVGITSAVFRSGILIPVLVSWYVWSEPMTWYRWIAMALIPIAMVLMRPEHRARERITFRGDLILCLCFLIAGVMATVNKSINVCSSQEVQPVYRLVLFMTAALSSLTYVIGRGFPFSMQALVLGAAAGLCNALALILLLLSLGVIPAVVFYPTSGCLVIGLNVVVSRILWRERVTKRQIMGILLAIAIVVLANLGM